MAAHEEIRDAYQYGEEAVIPLFEKAIGEFAARVASLGDQTATSSRNSSKSPTSGGLSKPTPPGLEKSDWALAHGVLARRIRSMWLE
jgi:hypothetical protein